MNAADPKQVKEGDKRERLKRRQELEDWRTILSMPAGRRLLWRLLGVTGVFRSIWDPSAKIHYRSGQQDFGHFLMAEAAEADPEAYLLMQREGLQRQQEAIPDVG